MNSGATSLSDPPPPPSATILAPGFRFHPTDEELVIYYLKRKVRGLSFRVDAIAEVDLYNCEPWDLPCRSRVRSHDLEWYFFSPLDRKYSSRSRTNRITPKGYWKTTGKDRPVRRGARVIGMKKTLVFHIGRAPRGNRSNWVMHEYRLEDEQLAEAGISHAAYVVCRIFEKSGAGPQNGAQYGAPFLEEEWEEEATGGVLLMPNAGEDESNGNMEQNEDLEEKRVNTSKIVGEIYSKDYNGLPKDVTISPDDVINDPCLTTNMTECINEPGQQRSPTPIDDVEKRPLTDDTHSQLNKTDKHMEFNEIKEFISYPMRNCYDQYVDGVVSNSRLQEGFDINEFFDTMGANSNQSEPCIPEECNFYMQPNGLSPIVDGYPSNQQYHDKTVYDAPSDGFKFKVGNSIELNGPLYLSTNNPSDLDVVDDLLVYFDATDDAIHYDIVGSLGDSKCNNSSDQFNYAGQVGCCNCPKSNVTGQDVAGTSSSGSSLACSKPMGKHEEEVQKTDVDDKTFARRLENMLGSISAPPAFADEYPGGSGKSCAQIAGTHSVGSVPFTARFIHLSGRSVSGDTEYWSFQKNQHAVILSCSMGDSRATNLATSDLIVTNQVDAVAKVLRGSLYLSFLSALSLAFGYNVIKRIFTVGKKILSIERLLSDRG